MPGSKERAWQFAIRVDCNLFGNDDQVSKFCREMERWLKVQYGERVNSVVLSWITPQGTAKGEEECVTTITPT